MKTLILLRHGKSDWGADYGDGGDGAGGHGADHERPLKKRGVRAARLAGRLLASMDLAPDAVLSSTAVRARTTAELAVEELEKATGREMPFETTSDLYLTSVDGALRILRDIESRFDPDAEIDRLLVVGHEPTTSSLAATIAGDSAASIRVVTGALVGLETRVNRWADLGPGRGDLVFLLPPRHMERIEDAAG